jgi:hypothetical protein
MINKKKLGIYSGLAVLLIGLTAAVLIQGGFFGLARELITGPLAVNGNKNVAQNSQLLEPGILFGKNSLSLRYDLRGICLIKGPASAITLLAEDGKEYSVSLVNYGQNCAYGEQNVKIPLKDFAIDQPTENIIYLSTQFWFPTSYDLEINRITAHPPSATFILDTKDNLLSIFGLGPKSPGLESSRGTAAVTEPVASGYTAEYWNLPAGTFSKPVFPTRAPDLKRNDLTIILHGMRVRRLLILQSNILRHVGKELRLLRLRPIDLRQPPTTACVSMWTMCLLLINGETRDQQLLTRIKL